MMSVAKSKLIVFVDNVHSDLELIIDNIEKWKNYRIDIHILVKEAWIEVQDNFDLGKREIENISDDTLKMYGLSGKQLDLKLAEYEKRKSDFLASPNYEPRDKRPRMWEVRLRKHLIAIDVVFDSLASSIPQLQAVKEIKEFLLSVFND